MNLPINSIICGDCLEVMKDWPTDCIDLTITSPPYDNLRDYQGYKFDFEGIAQQFYRITKQGGVVVWVVGDQTIDGSETGTSFKQALYFKEIGFNIHDTMIYLKKGFANPEHVRYHQVFEYMLVFSKGNPKTFNPIKDKLNTCVERRNFGQHTQRQQDGSLKVKVRKDKTISKFGMRYNVWEMKTASQENICKKNLLHPAQFPMALAKDHIISWSNPDEIILDPMCGSGTTCIAAKLLKRKYIGIDISNEYCKLSRNRLNNTEEGVFG